MTLLISDWIIYLEGGASFNRAAVLSITFFSIQNYTSTVKNLHFEKLWKLTNKYWLNKLLPNNCPQTKKNAFLHYKYTNVA